MSKTVFRPHVIDRDKFPIYTDRVFDDVYTYLEHPTKDEIWFKSLLFRLKQLRKLESILSPYRYYRLLSVKYLKARLITAHQDKKPKRIDEIQRRLTGGGEIKCHLQKKC